MDITNQGIPGAGGQLSGEVTRQAAIRRLEKEQKPRQTTSGPNTGPTGVPKAGHGLVQTPGNPLYSATPGKPKRI